MTDLSYRLKRGRRKSMALIVHEDQSLEIRCPHGIPRKQIEAFIREKEGWIERKRQEAFQAKVIGPLSETQLRRHIERFERLLNQALHQFDGPMPSKIRLRDLSSRWGSCSNRKAISINSRSLALPEALLEYIIYHELCHLVHMSHDAQFWQLLQTFLPDARRRQKTLNQNYRLKAKAS